MFLILKRDGTKVPFDKDKIIRAINGAMLEVDGKVYEYDTAKDIANDIEQDIIEIYNTTHRITSVEDIQDLVEDYLMRSERKDIARAYIRFRYKKEVARGVKDDFIKAVEEVLAELGASDKKTILVLNKIDNQINLYEIELATAEYSNWR